MVLPLFAGRLVWRLARRGERNLALAGEREPSVRIAATSSALIGPAGL
jgi:hypothetical protein